MLSMSTLRPTFPAGSKARAAFDQPVWEAGVPN
jgi:hypothetical protein